MARNKANNTWVLTAAALLVVIVAGLFVFGGGNNDGQPSAPSGPGNAMQNDQGR